MANILRTFKIKFFIICLIDFTVLQIALDNPYQQPPVFYKYLSYSEPVHIIHNYSRIGAK